MNALSFAFLFVIFSLGFVFCVIRYVTTKHKKYIFGAVFCVLIIFISLFFLASTYILVNGIH